MSDIATLDASLLGPYLEKEIPGFHGIGKITKFNAGQSNPTYMIEAQSGRYVLRSKPPGELLKSAHQVDREYRVIKALSATDVPVAPVYHLSGDDSPIGRMFYVMGFVEGRILWDPALPDIAEKAERAAIYDAMNGVLATLHDVDYRAIGLADFGKPGNYYERQLSRWSGQYRASETETVPEMEKLLSWLDTHLVPDDGIVSLVHGDYRIDNMIFANDRPEVLAVLDWELSTLGHPYADIAYQCMQWRLPNNSGFRGLGGIDRKAVGIPTEEDYVAAYCARRGLDGIDNWTFYLAFSFFRLAAICQGVYKRSLDGNASNPEKARSYGEAVRLLSRLAVDEIEENG
jgi:aminoglycoside phosphotransferase (APT) family kinase protein